MGADEFDEVANRLAVEKVEKVTLKDNLMLFMVNYVLTDELLLSIFLN